MVCWFFKNLSVLDKVFWSKLELRENEPSDLSGFRGECWMLLDTDREKKVLNLSRCVSDHSTSNSFQPLLLYKTERRRSDAGPGWRHLERPFSLCEIFRDAVPHCSLSESGGITVFCFRQGWSKPGQGSRLCSRLFFHHYSPNWFIFTDRDSRWITVASRSVECEGRTWSHAKSVRCPGPCAMDLLWRWSYLFCLTVVVCLIFLPLLVRTEKDLHHVGLCVISNHNIKGCLHRLWPSVKAVVIWYDDPLRKHPN